MFNFYISDQTNLDRNVLYIMAACMQDWFNQICKGTNHKYAEFHWVFGPGQVADNELLVYIVGSQLTSIIKWKAPNFPLGYAGATYLDAGGMISEIYLEACRGDPHFARHLAVVAFHELMHNKLDANPSSQVVSDIHTQGGQGMALANLASSTMLTDGNIGLMRGALDRKQPQYTNRV